MNKFLLLILFSMILNKPSIAQKQALDSSTFDKWPAIGYAKITGDGKYSMYNATDNISGVSSLTILSNTGNWKFIANNIHSEAIFSRDSKEVLFVSEHDSLTILKLGTEITSLVPNVTSFEVSESTTDEWITYVDVQKKLIVSNTSNNKKFSFSNTDFHFFSKNGRSILLTLEDTLSHRKTLKWFDLMTGHEKIVWTGSGIEGYVMDDSCNRLSFFGSASEADMERPSLYYFKLGMNAAVPRISGDSLFKSGMVLDQGSLQFNRSGTKLLFSIYASIKKKVAVDKNGSGVVVWNYKDSNLQSVQRASSVNQWSAPKIVKSLDLINSRIVTVKQVDEKFFEGTTPFENYKLIFKLENDNLIQGKNPYSLKLVSLADGKVLTIMDTQATEICMLSPDERFVIWFDPVHLTYFDYETETGTIRKIVNGIPVKLYDEQEAVNMGRPDDAAYGLCGWSVRDHSVYLYDQFDIWKLDLFGIGKPLNVTNGYGRSNSLVLGRIDMEEVSEHVNFDDLNQILLSALNINNKDNGIVVFDRDFKHRIKDGLIGPFSYCIRRTSYRGSDLNPGGRNPVKAKNCDKYLVQRMSVSEFPNLFLTADFKNYKQLSFFQPEKKYNWMTSKLLTWKNFEGKSKQGILYLPEDFDSTKKYPVIFECYEKMSNDLNEYLTPELSCCRIDISYYVSSGYMVFEPDITWEKGTEMGAGFVSSVVSGYQHLSGFRWVDSTRIGFQGHSFGGWIANYIATHTHVFAAVCATAGFTDAIGGYDELKFKGKSSQKDFEYGQEGIYGLGVTPWTNPEIYIANSPLFGVGNTTTPLLLVAGEKDVQVPYQQSQELYLALRRAGKKVWLLDYEQGEHGLIGSDSEDYTIRMKQFFDHYLKNAPPPLWMTKGVPFSERGSGDPFKLDASEVKP